MPEITKIKVLLIDDDEDEFVIVQDLFSEIDSGFELTWVDNYDEALEHILNKRFDVYLIDYRLGPQSGLDLIREVHEEDIIAPMILLTGQGDRKIDLAAMSLGASDYLVKTEVNSNLLARSIRYAITSSHNLLELRTKEIKYRLLFERSVDPIYLIDRNFRFTDLNQSLVQLLGHDREKMIDMPLSNIFKRDAEIDYFQELLSENEQIRDLEVELITLNGAVKECLINGVALKDNKGNVYGYQGIIHDLSMRKRAEQELLLAEKLAMTGNIARSIAHEVRNPLTNLNLALEQLWEELEESLLDDHGMYMEIIQRNANRIDQLITEMLKSSKPKEPDLKPYSLNDLVNDVLDMTRDRIKLRGIKLSLDIDPTLPMTQIDPELLKTAILNIVINAIEAMDEKQEGELKVGTFTRTDNVVVYVEDSGKGIPKEQIRKLFDPFFTGKRGGMGLGLTSAQNIVNSHKGKVNVQSTVGEGTRFEISFPINQLQPYHGS